MSFLVLLLRPPLTCASSEALPTTRLSAFLLVVKSGTSFSSIGSPDFSLWSSYSFSVFGAESQGLFKLGCFPVLSGMSCVCHGRQGSIGVSLNTRPINFLH